VKGELGKGKEGREREIAWKEGERREY